MSDKTEAKLQDFYARIKEVYHLGCAKQLLGWDQQVNLPALGGEARANQLAALEKISHERMTDRGLIDLVEELSACPLPFPHDVNVREIKRDIEKLVRLPGEFVSRQAFAQSQTQQAWEHARPKNDFAAVQPLLDNLIRLAREQADYLGYKKHRYDALLDLYDPALTVDVVKPLLTKLGDELATRVPRISENFKNTSELKGTFPEEQQYALNRRATADIGFNYNAGRLDRAAHPFCSSAAISDVRLTTRYNRDNFMPSLYGALHEAGHGLYEQGLLLEHEGTPMGTAVSMSVHESQSRFWENLIGRSHEYMVYLKRVGHEYFPDQFAALSEQELWNGANRVRPSLIRVEADEVTYSLHIVIRMLLEEGFISGELAIKDLPVAWADLYKRYLGLTPPNHKDGVLQDIHWYMGAYGYFPTYALGNLYSAAFLASAQHSMPSLTKQVERGEFSQLRSWLKQNVHEHGRRFSGLELLKRVTGQELSVGPFVGYLDQKYR